MTLDEAVKKLSSDNQIDDGYDPNMIVWFVTMDGVWLDEFPKPDNLPTPAPYHHYVLILDAKDGSEIQVSILP